MVFISTKFGFISALQDGTDYTGQPVKRAFFCVDVRDAMPFENRGEAEKAFRKTTMSKFWHCILSSMDTDISTCPTEGGVE